MPDEDLIEIEFNFDYEYKPDIKNIEIYKLKFTVINDRITPIIDVDVSTNDEPPNIKLFDEIKYLNIHHKSRVNRLFKLPKSLIALGCHNNHIDLLPTLPSTLKQLFCFYNILTELPTLPDGIKFIQCQDNRLTRLPKLPDSLEHLSCGNNLLTKIENLPYSLKHFSCSNNKLTECPYLPMNLTHFFCNEGLFKEIPFLPDTLKELYVNYCKELETLPNKLPPKLKKMGIRCTKITHLPKLPNTLKELFCVGSQLKTLPDECNLDSEFNSDMNYYYNTPIEQTIRREYNGNPFKYIVYLMKKQKKSVNYIGEWYLDKKYNPEYKFCRKRVMDEYDETYGENQEDKFKKQKLT